MAAYIIRLLQSYCGLYILLISVTYASRIIDGKLTSNSRAPDGNIYHYIFVEEGRSDEFGACFKMSFGRDRGSSEGFIRRSLKAIDKNDCERQCLLERSFVCRGFYHRHMLGTGPILNNCHLMTLDKFSDNEVLYKGDFVFYERIRYRDECSDGINGLFQLPRNDDFYRYRDYNNDITECFRLERTGFRPNPLSVLARISARDLGHCQQECQRTRNFICRSIAFRYSSTGFVFGGENCLLSDEDNRSRTSRYNLVRDTNFDFYTNDGRCYVQAESLRRRELPSWEFNYRDGGFETVKGVKCLQQCRQDQFGRYFFCEVDLKGRWDYCCRPGSVCTYDSQAQYNKCQVGFRSYTQWQPCFNNNIRGFSRAFLQESKTNSTSSNRINTSKKDNLMIKESKKSIEVANLNDIL